MSAGIIDGYWTPGAARLAVLFQIDQSAREAQRLCREVGMAVGASTVNRLLKGLSGRWEEGREAHEAQVRQTEEVPATATVVCISVDGVMAPLREKTAKRQEKRAEAGKHASGPSGYKEIGCGTVALYDAEGERLDTLYEARMPQAN
jgi:hypothetical protein